MRAENEGPEASESEELARGPRRSRNPLLRLLRRQDPIEEEPIGRRCVLLAEAALIDRIHAAKSDETAYIIVNPAAFTHTSVALRDALAAVRIPFIEVHLSNVHAREPFRHHSYFSDLAAGVIVGLGPLGYELAMEAALRATSAPAAS